MELKKSFLILLDWEKYLFAFFLQELFSWQVVKLNSFKILLLSSAPLRQYHLLSLTPLLSIHASHITGHKNRYY